MSITSDEIDRGLVLHMDPAVLLANGAKVKCPVPSRIVTSGHFFLCLGVDATHGDWAPLYSKNGPGRAEIPASGKQGYVKWTGAPSYYHSDQIWTVSHTGAVAAAGVGGDMSKRGNRNTVDEAAIPPI